MKSYFILFAIIVLIFTGCRSTEAASPEHTFFTSFRDIPGVTPEDIVAVEAIKEQFDYFVFGTLPNTEAFLNIDNEITGFSVLLCEWLTELFDVPFIPEHFTWAEMLDGLSTHEISFAGNLTPNEERRRTYIMTDTIATRTAVYIYLTGTELSEIAEIRLPRYAFLEGVVAAADVIEAAGEGAFEYIFVSEYIDAYELMHAGEIDALITKDNNVYVFYNFDDIEMEYFLPLVYSAASLATQNPELEPIIRIMQKALEGNAITHLNMLYNLGHQEYTKHMFNARISEEARAFIRDNPRIPIAAEFDNYPVSFFNTRQNEWQGIAHDILREIESLTGLEFEIVNENNTNFSTLLQMLKDGEALMHTEVIRTPEREDRLLWSCRSFITHYPALISSINHPSVNINGVMPAKIGLINGAGYTEMFFRWFPDHKNYVLFDDQKEMFPALENGDIDMIMLSTTSLLYMTHFLEFSGFKVNLAFSDAQHGTFGINRNAEELRDIIDTALGLIDNDVITQDWMRRTYDYRAAMLEEQARIQWRWTIGAGIVLFVLIFSFWFVYERNRRKDSTISGQSATINAIYDSIPAVVFTKDLNNKYTSCNSKFLDLLDAVEYDLIGKTIFNKDSPIEKNLNEIFEENDYLFNTNDSFYKEYWYIAPDGSRRAHQAHITPLTKDGKPEGILGILVDITARKISEEEIHKAYTQATMMLDSSPICTQLWDRDLNTIDCNQAAVKLYGFKDKKEYTERFIQECSPEYQPCGERSDAKAIRLANQAFEEGYVSFDWMHQMPDGETMIPAYVILARIGYMDDYIVAGYTRDLREQNQMMQRIEYRDKLLQAVNSIATILLNAEVESFNESIIRSMELMAKAVKVDCVYMWKNHIKDEQLYCSQLYEWAEAKTVFASDDMYRYEEVFPGWYDILSKGECINGLMRDMPEESQNFLSPLNVVSILVVPVFMQDRFWGFVGFDDWKKERKFSDTEISILHAGNLLFASAMTRYEKELYVRDTSLQLVDATEKSIQAEEKQRRTATRMEAIINNVPGMVYQCIYKHPEYPMVYVSAGSKKLLGYAPNEIIGIKNMLVALIHPDDDNNTVEKCEASITAGLMYDNIYRLLMPSGEIKWVWERASVLERNPDGTPYLVEGYVSDVTERWQLEEAESASRAKSNFLAVMSHEIRTPMNSILGFAELALEIAITPQVKDYLRKITDGTKWLLNIINNILDISKIESGKLELEEIPFDLQEVVSRCQSVALPLVNEKGLDLSLYVETLPGKRFLGDPLRIYQALSNLLSNAIKFTDEGVIKLSCLVKPVKNVEDVASVYFEVKDSGIGMTSEQVKRIFEPFTQADSSTTRSYGGTGLGLTITKNIAELMDSELKVESALGIGSRFSFEIMFATIDAPESKSFRTDLSTIEKPTFNSLVLVCDDNHMNQEVICDHLANVGIRTVVANNGKIGYEIVKERMERGERPFDLIFMDIFMPVMDGNEAASKIAALNTGIPIVALTANVMVSETETYKKNGMLDCLGKPFTTQELWRILLKYLKPFNGDNRINKNESFEDELYKKLQISFITNNKNLLSEIKEALAANNITIAHRLMHNLKSNAGYLGITDLQEVAAEIESLLKNELLPIPKTLMTLLESKLTSLLAELMPLINEADEPPQENNAPVISADSEKTQKLFSLLKILLENRSADCLSLLPELRAVPGTETLVHYIERYRFRLAAEALEELTGN
ncbi:MAG: transporter substrate-binding domain-containing protein [Defluviitaleaceae bacterium]|nr:transporter substrate-binding domain-containing protein [Defluviitaleaceae bacterium]